jgi:hypothetical protein
VTKPLYEHAQELFLSWARAKPEETPELLIQLRVEQDCFTLFRERTSVTHHVVIKKMTSTAIQITGTVEKINMIPATQGEKVLCVYYGKNRSLGFLSSIQSSIEDVLEIDYPQHVWIRTHRKHERFGLLSNISAFWSNAQRDEPIFGQVMDISYGGFLGGMQMAAYDDGSLNIKIHERGEIILLKSDQTRWRSEAELSRSAIITQSMQDSDTIIVPAKGFALLGFAFIFKDQDTELALEKFLDGIIDPL